MELKVNGIYKHYKSKDNRYLIIGISIHSETLEEYVVYKALYDEEKLWIRPLKMFFDEVNSNDQKYRFELVEEYNYTSKII